MKNKEEGMKENKGGRPWKMSTPFELTPAEKKVLELRHEGRTYREIAEILHLSNVHYSLSTALHKERTIEKFKEIGDKFGESSLARARGKKRMKGTK